MLRRLRLAGCTAGPATNQRATATARSNAATTAKPGDPEDRPPVVGMTKAQVLARYGKPKTQTVTDDGERWTYVLNIGEFVGKHMIPFFFSTQTLRFGVIFFGPDERVKKFNWDTPTED
ncbi:MAG TPA: outer membrane protein assembly factor BamE [Pyrinomonadaceae bacterium]|nr:outer membrane protein assembly factor BamE [Pyrinomonadaceae bacterium]